MDSVKFSLETFVYMKVKPDTPGMITGVLFRPCGVLYYVTWGNAEETYHHEIELTTDKTFDWEGAK